MCEAENHSAADTSRGRQASSGVCTLSGTVSAPGRREDRLAALGGEHPFRVALEMKVLCQLHLQTFPAVNWEEQTFRILMKCSS